MSDLDELTKEMQKAGFLDRTPTPAVIEEIDLSDEDIALLENELIAATNDPVIESLEIKAEAGDAVVASDPLTDVVTLDEMDNLVEAVQEEEKQVVETAPVEAETPKRRGRPPSATPRLPKPPKPARIEAGPGTIKLFEEMGFTEGPNGKNFLDFEATVNSLPVKIREKVVNLVQHYLLGNELHTYSKIGFAFIKSKKEFTLSDVVEHLHQTGYTIGTSRSQGQQVVKLLETYGAIEKKDKGYVINESHFIFA